MTVRTTTRSEYCVNCARSSIDGHGDQGKCFYGPSYFQSVTCFRCKEAITVDTFTELFGPVTLCWPCVAKTLSEIAP